MIQSQLLVLLEYLITMVWWGIYLHVLLFSEGVNLRHRFQISVINTLWTMITGDRVDLDDPSLLALVKRMDKLTSSSQMKKPIR